MGDWRICVKIDQSYSETAEKALCPGCLIAIGLGECEAPVVLIRVDFPAMMLRFVATDQTLKRFCIFHCA